MSSPGTEIPGGPSLGPLPRQQRPHRVPLAVDLQLLEEVGGLLALAFGGEVDPQLLAGTVLRAHDEELGSLVVQEIRLEGDEAPVAEVLLELLGELGPLLLVQSHGGRRAG